MRSKSDIGEEVADLGELPREELVERWRKIYGMFPPKGVRRDLLVRAAAWHLQAKRLGGLSVETRRLLRSATSRVESEMLARGSNAGRQRLDDGGHDRDEYHPVDGNDTSTAAPEGAHLRTGDRATDRQALKPAAAGVPRSPPRQRRRLTPGARLIREWNGRTHVVDVIEGGYVFEAKVYRSLTAIAGKITGVHWSGPRFFGL
jgi:hypothetical protein